MFFNRPGRKKENPDAARQFLHACYTGQLDAAKTHVTDVDLKKEGLVAVALAASAGHLEVLKWLMTSSRSVIDLRKDEKLLQRTLLKGHFDVLQWFTNDCPQKVSLFTGDASADFDFLKRVLQEGSLAAIQYLVEAHNPPMPLTAFDGALFSESVRFNQLPILRWLVEDGEAASRRNPAWHEQSIPTLEDAFNTRHTLLCMVHRAPADVLQYLFEDSTRSQEIRANPQVLNTLNQYTDSTARKIQHLCAEALEAELAPLRQQIDALSEKMTQLADAAARQQEQYCNSASCRKAVEAGLVASHAQLVNIIEVAPGSRAPIR